MFLVVKETHGILEEWPFYLKKISPEKVTKLRNWLSSNTVAKTACNLILSYNLWSRAAMIL